MNNTKNQSNKQGQKNQQKTQQKQGSKKRGQNPNLLHDDPKHQDHEHPETRMTR